MKWSRIPTHLILVGIFVSILLIAFRFAIAKPDAPGSIGELFIHQVQGAFQSNATAKVLLLSAPIPVPSTPLVGDVNEDPLAKLWGVPTVKDNRLTPSDGKRISQLLDQYFSDIGKFTTGSAQLTQEESQKLDQALRVLFVNPNNKQNPTTTYTRYRSWQEKRSELVKSIQDPENASKLNILTTQLRNLDDSFNLSGDKSKVETALQLVARYTPEKDTFPGELNSIRDAIKSDVDANPLRDLYSRLASRQAWTRVSITSGQGGLPSSLNITLTDNENQATILPLQIKDASFDFIVVGINQPLLQAPLLSNRAWKRNDSLIISDGDATTKANNEVIPQYITHIVVIRNFDLGLDTKSTNYTAFSKAIITCRSGSVDSLAFTNNGTQPFHVLPGHIFIPFPKIVAATTDNLNKTPNPSDALSWE